jgi:predicted PurR-regulated permease PerM
MVSLLQRSRIPRLAAVSIVFAVFMVGMIVIILWLIPLTVKQISQLVQQLPGMLATVQYRLLQLPTSYPDLISEVQVRQVIEFLNAGISTLGKRVLTLSLASVVGLLHLVVYLVLVPFMVFFLLKDKADDPGLGSAFSARQHGSYRIRVAGGQRPGDQLHTGQRLGAADYLGRQLCRRSRPWDCSFPC